MADTFSEVNFYKMIVLILFFMPSLGLVIYNLKDKWLLTASIMGAAALSTSYFIVSTNTTNFPPKLIFFYAVTYILTALTLKNVGAGLLITSATTGFWEWPTQIYVYLGYWNLVEFSGWTWCIYCTMIVYSLLWIAKIPLRKAAPFIVLPMLANAVMAPQQSTWYFCRILTASTLAYLVWKYGEKGRRSWLESRF